MPVILPPPSFQRVPSLPPVPAMRQVGRPPLRAPILPGGLQPADCPELEKFPAAGSNKCTSWLVPLPAAGSDECTSWLVPRGTRCLGRHSSPRCRATPTHTSATQASPGEGAGFARRFLPRPHDLGCTDLSVTTWDLLFWVTVSLWLPEHRADAQRLPGASGVVPFEPQTL